MQRTKVEDRGMVLGGEIYQMQRTEAWFQGEKIYQIQRTEAWFHE
jgi:hypothetical protein